MPDEGSLPVGQPKSLMGKDFPSGKDSSVGWRFAGRPLNDSCKESPHTPAKQQFFAVLSPSLQTAACHPGGGNAGALPTGSRARRNW